MVRITKKQSEFIRGRAPYIRQVVVNRQGTAKKKKIYIEESEKVFQLLAEFIATVEPVLELHWAH